jgi:Uma2 family endonuclease
MAIPAESTLTADEFWALPEKPGIRLELVDGEFSELPGSNWLHAELVLHILDLIRAYVLAEGLGRAYGDGPAYFLARDPDTLRIPDVSFIPTDRLPKGGPPATYVDVPPALVVEIDSPSNSAADYRLRIRDYMNAGVSLIWVVWPDERSVSVYSGSTSPVKLTSDDTLDGGDVLPGFSVKVADLFDIDW